MSYFSLLTPSDPNEDGDYRVEEAHINVWSLPGVFWHRPMVIDVGVLFEQTTTRRLRAMPMVVPARVVKQVNLSSELASSDTARLIFGRRFNNSDNERLTLDGYGVVTLVSVDDEKLDVDHHGDLTGVRVTLGDVPNGLCYLRVRFVVDGGGAMWRWRRVAGRRDGALVDFRVHDPREGGANRKVQVDFDRRDKPIKSLEAFFMLPDTFQLSGQNPKLKYSRTLEGRRWQEYLNRSPEGLVRRERILVHRWKVVGSENRDAVSEDNPFRGYLQFNRRPAIRSVWDIVLGGLVAVVLLYALMEPLTLRDGPHEVAGWGGDRIREVADRVAEGLLALTVISLVIGALHLVPKVRGWTAKVRRTKRVFKWAEFKYFALLKAIRPR